MALFLYCDGCGIMIQPNSHFCIILPGCYFPAIKVEYKCGQVVLKKRERKKKGVAEFTSSLIATDWMTILLQSNLEHILLPFYHQINIIVNFDIALCQRSLKTRTNLYNFLFPCHMKSIVTNGYPLEQKIANRPLTGVHLSTPLCIFFPLHLKLTNAMCFVEIREEGLLLAERI